MTSVNNARKYVLAFMLDRDRLMVGDPERALAEFETAIGKTVAQAIEDESPHGFEAHPAGTCQVCDFASIAVDTVHEEIRIITGGAS